VQSTEIEHAPRHSPILRRAVVGLVAIAVAALVIHLIVGLLSGSQENLFKGWPR